jgi:hypothetical protein
METTRLLLPFTSGVDMKHINHALYLAKASGVTLVTLSLIPMHGLDASVRPERIQQSKDFQEAFRARAELYQVPVEQQECTVNDPLTCIFSTARQMNCQSILLVFDEEKPCFLLPEESQRIRQASILPLYILQLPAEKQRVTFKHVFSRLRVPLKRVS